LNGSELNETVKTNISIDESNNDHVNLTASGLDTSNSDIVIFKNETETTETETQASAAEAAEKEVRKQDDVIASTSGLYDIEESSYKLIEAQPYGDPTKLFDVNFVEFMKNNPEQNEISSENYPEPYPNVVNFSRR
jgi:hypothetical protein